jgi:hypothetical protein
MIDDETVEVIAKDTGVFTPRTQQHAIKLTNMQERVLKGEIIWDELFKGM